MSPIAFILSFVFFLSQTLFILTADNENAVFYIFCLTLEETLRLLQYWNKPCVVRDIKVLCGTVSIYRIF